MTNGRILDRVTFDTSTAKNQESLNPLHDTLRPRIGPLDLQGLSLKQGHLWLLHSLDAAKTETFFLVYFSAWTMRAFLYCYSPCKLGSTIRSRNNQKLQKYLKAKDILYSTTMSDRYLVHCQRVFLQRRF